MNRSRYVPFERNRYFYGKLLTVRDFMSEQTYISDKRRLTNRLLFGSGVITGLQVVAVDDQSISIETGAAIDQMGREIIVPSPVTMKLSNIDGFTHNEYAKNVYLCLAYDEVGKEPVHTVTGSMAETEEVSEHNRILESYRLYIQEQPPAPSRLEYDHLIEDTSIWYDDGQVRVLQTVPRYIEPGQRFPLRLTIEKTLQTPHISFEYEPEFQHADVEQEIDLIDGKIVFSEPMDSNETIFTKTIYLRAHPLEPNEDRQHAVIESRDGTAKLVIGDKLIHDISYIRQSVEVSEKPVNDRILQAFYSRSLDRAIESPNDPCVYLAKISLLQMGASYVIDHVESLPFNDYVMNPTVLYRLLERIELGQSEHAVVKAAQEEAAAAQVQEEDFPDIQQEFASIMGDEQEQEPELIVTTGVTEISIVPEVEKKWYQPRQKNFISEEIEHGLGAGTAVMIHAALSDEEQSSEIPIPEMWQRSNAIYSGALETFAGSEFALDYPAISIGTIQYPKKGTFRIGIRVHKKTERTRIRIRWWATKAVELSSQDEMTAEEIEAGMQSAAATKE